MPCISTDTIRRDMRVSLSRKQFPGLFLLDESTIGDPVDYLSRTTVDKIVSDVQDECRDVWKGVLARVRNAVNESLAIEGVAILPEQVRQLMNEQQGVRAAILVNSDANRIWTIVEQRGLGGPPERFPDWIKQKQFEWVRRSNIQYRSAAILWGLPVIDLADEHHVDNILGAIS
mgnify:CR=1 FL=1